MKLKFVILSLLLIWSCIGIGQTKRDSLLVFIGEKISVTKFWPEYSDSIFYDPAVKAKYKVIQMLHGCYSYDTIEFEAYDHHGRFDFSKFKNALLFVENESGKLYHEKYMFTDVYKTKNDRWAGSYQYADYHHDLNTNTKVKPEPIAFAEEVSYEIPLWVPLEDVIKVYPPPYFVLKDRKAIVIWGNYVEDLFELKKKGFLKSRGIFD